MKWALVVISLLAAGAGATALTVGVIGEATASTDRVILYLMSAWAVLSLSAVILYVGERILTEMRACRAAESFLGRINHDDDSSPHLRRIRP